MLQFILQWYCKGINWSVGRSGYLYLLSLRNFSGPAPQAVTVWDLHVGAEVDILGRMTTLHLGCQWVPMIYGMEAWG